MPNAHELLLRTRDPTTGREVQPSGAAAEACPRRGFVAAPGCVLLSADYKQAELRLMAHFRWLAWGLLAHRGMVHGNATGATTDTTLCQPRIICLSPTQRRRDTARHV